jgi:thiamine biosynthesis lipoprotein
VTGTGKHAFHSMGCPVVVSGATPAELRAIERLFAERERIFSRFVGGSELNRVNAAAGRPVRVSPAFAAMLSLALGAARETDGLVVPTLGAELEAAGYDRDFSELGDDPRPPAEVAPPAGIVRLAGRWAFVLAGARLDLNGVVKGRTVDDALALMQGNGFVSAGGDLAARGPVVVALPAGGTVRLVRGALATSGTDRRRWSRGGRLQHHLIDPYTGRPAESPWEQVTVCGRSCLGADVAAKAALLRGADGPAWLDACGLPARFVATAGGVIANRSWQASLGRTAAAA